MLELFEDVARGDDEDLVALAAADQLRQDHPDLERLAETDRVGDQQARAETGQRLVGGAALVLEAVQELVLGDGEVGVRRRDRRLAQDRFEVEA